jgi:uncharacterized membrane protein YsdA (DUF1294 family)/cold shock CspA family protein
MPDNAPSTLTGTITEWDDQKGYGYVQSGQARIFLHRRDFSERHKRPEVGDIVSFCLGQDAKGRPCAKNASHMNDGGKITVMAVLFLSALLILPTFALYSQPINLRWVGLYFVTLSFVSYFNYANDKRKARAKEWRISESTLQVTALIGGWPGAFLAQRRLRHKVSKLGFQIVFWLIVFAYQVVAFDSLQSWRFSKQVWNHLQQTRPHVR